MQEKRRAGSAAQLAEALKGMSSGSQPVVCVSDIEPGLVFVAGAQDTKFVRLADQLAHAGRTGEDSINTEISSDKTLLDVCSNNTHIPRSEEKYALLCIIPHCGHAVHIERPEALVHFLHRQLARITKLRA